MSKSRVVIGTYQQNCYVTDGCLKASSTSFPNEEMKTYVSLEKVEMPNGFKQELVVKDYPITSESVSSLAEGADYRNDPAQAIANAPQRVNLGDITEAQKFLSNPQNYAKVFDSVKKELAVYMAKQIAQQQPTQEIKQDEVKNNEV